MTANGTNDNLICPQKFNRGEYSFEYTLDMLVQPHPIKKIFTGESEMYGVVGGTQVDDKFMPQNMNTVYW